MGRLIPKRYDVIDKEDAPGDSDTIHQEIPGLKTHPSSSSKNSHSNSAKDIFCHNISVSVLTCISIKALRYYILEQGKPKSIKPVFHFGYSERFSGQLCSLPTLFPIALRLCKFNKQREWKEKLPQE